MLLSAHVKCIIHIAQCFISLDYSHANYVGLIQALLEMLEIGLQFRLQVLFLCSFMRS